MNEDANPWDRLEDHNGPLGPEDNEWYARFLHYLNQPGKRSFRTTYEAWGLGGDGDQYKVSESWRLRIVEYRWKERAAAYDVARQLARKEGHKATADDVYDDLYAGAQKAVKTIVGYATDRRSFGKNPQHDKIRLQAAMDVLDRLGFGKRAPRPIYAEQAEDADKLIRIELVGLDEAALERLARYDDEDGADYD